MREKILSAMLVLLILAAAIACGSGGEKITGQELVDSALASMQNQETYGFETSMYFTMSGTLGGEYGEMDSSMDYKGVADMTAQKMQMDMTTIMSVRATTQTEETSTFKIYIMDDIAYYGLVSQVAPTKWVKGDVSQDLWDTQDYVSKQMELLRGAEAEILGTETVKGIDCYKAEISPDMDVLVKYMSSQLGEEYPSVEFSEDSISNYSLKGWFARDTFFPMKSHQEFDMKIDIEGDEATYHFIIDTLFYDWNKSVSIELPAEAEEAEYIGPIDI